MADANISTADMGVSIPGMNGLMKKIESKVIIEGKNKLQDAKEAFENKLPEVWVGVSADKFKENLDNDLEALKKAFDETYKALEFEITEVKNAMLQIDADIEQKNKG